MVKNIAFMALAFVLSLTESFASDYFWDRRSDHCVESLAKRTKSDEGTHLKVEGINSAAELIALLEERPNLKSLDLGDCNWLTDDDATLITPFINPRLTSLNLGGYKCTHFLGQPAYPKTSVSFLTNKGLATFVRHCGALTSLDIWKCMYINDEGASIIADNCQRLTYFRSGNTGITGHGYCTVFEKCQSLSVVNLMYSCDNFHLGHRVSCGVTDDSLAVLAANGKSLTALNLWGCKKTTDKGIAHIINGCPGLTILDLTASGTGVTKATLDLIRSKKGAGLTSLNVGQSQGITDYEHYMSFIRDHPGITVDFKE